LISPDNKNDYLKVIWFNIRKHCFPNIIINIYKKKYV
jgi:hypothetical protein